MMRTVFILLLVTLCASVAYAQLPETQLDLLHVRSLDNGENRTCLAASWQVASVKKVPLTVDVLFAPDFEALGNWGLGASIQLTDLSKRLKLGIGFIGGLNDPVAYIGFRLN